VTTSYYIDCHILAQVGWALFL